MSRAERRLFLIVLILFFLIGLLIEPHLRAGVYTDDYTISIQTYENVPSWKYDLIHDEVARKDHSAAQAMSDAAREVCEGVWGGQFNGKSMRCE